jgi:hypothetical protein
MGMGHEFARRMGGLYATTASTLVLGRLRAVPDYGAYGYLRRTLGLERT